jgi:hypothetical protein
MIDTDFLRTELATLGTAKAEALAQLHRIEGAEQEVRHLLEEIEEGGVEDEGNEWTPEDETAAPPPAENDLKRWERNGTPDEGEAIED